MTSQKTSHRLRQLILLSLIAASMPASLAQQQDSGSQPCSSKEHHAFDFWIGAWKVTAGDKLAGHNRIEPILGGCALMESWSGAQQTRGRSLNFYDAARDEWHQTWIDNSGGALHLSGGLVDGNMVLLGRRPPAPGSGSKAQTLHRITWTPGSDGTVRQHWEASEDDGTTWQTLFDGLYRKDDSTR